MSIDLIHFKHKEGQIFELDTSRLPDNRIHLLFPEGKNENFFVKDILSLNTFKDQPGLCIEQSKQFLNTTFHLFSFPKESLDVCIRIAKIYGCGCWHQAQAAVTPFGTAFIPCSEKIIFIRSPNHITPDAIRAEREKIRLTYESEIPLD